MNDWLSDLQAKRRRFVDSVRENEFESGVRQSAVEKYADPIHFVFELIQNAEDQEATLARFTLRDGVILFEHDGNPFSRGDVERITGWGISDKPNQANKIGRFGIGFKSVFMVTDSPDIYVKAAAPNSVRSFGIRELFIPEVIEKEDPAYAIPATHDCATRFVLRFRDKDASQLAALIGRKFESFSADALLFLNHLKKIEWSAGKVSGVCERRDREHIRRLETVLIEKGGAPRQMLTRHLVCERPVAVRDVERGQSVKLAFLLDHEYQIVAEEPAPPLHVFFPTEERLGLKFRLHAPFLLTDNRANIKKGVAENEFLVSECAKMLREAVDTVKAHNKLTIGFLRILPFSRTAFPPDSILAPLFDAAFECLYKDRVLPCADETFCTWWEARFSRDPGLLELFSDKLLTELLESDRRLRWLHKNFGRSENQEFFGFLEDGITKELSRRDDPARLDLPQLRTELKWYDLANQFSKAFLEARADKWIEALYAYLDKQEVSQWKSGVLWLRPIIRLSDGRHVAAFRYDRSPNAFLPSNAAGSYDTVKPAVIRQDDALSFVKRIGIGAPDEAAHITKIILPRYIGANARAIPFETHLADFAVVSGFLEKSAAANAEPVLKELEKLPFFYARNIATGVCEYCHGNRVYIGNHELAAFMAGNDKAWLIHEDYAGRTEMFGRLFKIPHQINVKFKGADALGHVIVLARRGHYERGLNRFDPEAEVDGLECALRSPTLEKAGLIWNRVLILYPFLIKGEVEYSSRADYGGTRRRVQPSRFGRTLTETRWMPKPDGGWDFPKNLSMEDLPEEFVRNHEVAVQLGMKQSLVSELAAQKKINIRLLQQMLEAAELDPEKCEQMFNAFSSALRGSSGARGPAASTERSPLERLADAFVAPGKTVLETPTVPLRGVSNPERYRGELERQLKDRKANERPREQRQGIKLRRVWEDAKPEVREFLLQTYDGRCQVTGNSFAKRDGKPYFEVWYLISTTEAEWLDEPGNALCVCPEYWAKLEYGTREADPATLIEQIVRWKAAAEGGREEAVLRIKLCGEEVAIRYREQHLLRLQNLVKGLNASAESRAGPPTVVPPTAAKSIPPTSSSAGNLLHVCPYCGAQVGAANIEAHKNLRCPQRPSPPSNASRSR